MEAVRYHIPDTTPYTTPPHDSMNPHAGVDMTSPASSALQHTPRSTVPVCTLLTTSEMRPLVDAASVMLSATRSLRDALSAPCPRYRYEEPQLKPNLHRQGGVF